MTVSPDAPDEHPVPPGRSAAHCPMIDLDDTSGCPVGHRCESCGTESGSLAVETATSARLGFMCLTLCRRCAAFDDQIPVSVGTAVRLVAQHCGHLGITVDDVAAQLERER